ncbi:hypothetical protein ADK57_33435 [Streptomyces sp. MMG1533]|uniref:hypothetical protein n=1 Tax=Streptomyces sp. MMG1533 TaxID=1415546 RepID=UPI0006AF7547|nr:hypothetical protein [Streptomyces sp. MMG1533]KOU59466.1 hypothetical protein ADK57_33435 [Streptomyces sp. MMG1533]
MAPRHALAALLFVTATHPAMACFTAIQVLTMCEVLGGRLRDARGVGHRLLTAAAWILWAFTFCWLVGLAAGSSAAWVTWVGSDCQVRPVTLYTVWLATTTTVTVMAILAIR